MVWGYSKLNITSKWYLKHDHNNFPDISKICSYLGKTLSLNVLKVHALRGCDTKCYFHQRGENKVVKKLLGQQDLFVVLSELGNYSQITNNDIENTKEFIRAVLYNGSKQNSYINTKDKLYKGLKQKFSLTLPSDADSVTQSIKIVNLQITIWLQLLNRNLTFPSSE